METRELPTSPATTREERILAEVLAEILDVGQIAPDHHFFEELGADSLTMAKFCARVRRRGGLPSISMQDVYAHPTIRSLAAELSTRTTGDIAPAAEPATPTLASEYVVCGVLQLAAFLGYAYLAVATIVQSGLWVYAGSGAIETYLRLVAVTSIVFVTASLVPVAAKWLLIGRFKPGRIRLWSLEYFRFWIVKTLIRSSPCARLFVGTPIYPLYLRALGARIGPGVAIFSRRVPVCTDLISIGGGTVIRPEVVFLGYRVESGRLEMGAVTVGRDAFVGEGSVLEIETTLGDGAQLGHVSALHRGQAIPAGERWHGSPARRTEVSYLRVPPLPRNRLRELVFSTLGLFAIVFLYLPLLPAGISLLMRWSSSVGESLVLEAVIFSLILCAGTVLVGSVVVIALPRVLSPLLEPGRVYPLYGVHDAIQRSIARVGRWRFFTNLLGDSSYIVPFLRAIGYDLSRVVQTGSNFGTEVKQAHPRLCFVGSGTMVADGLVMMNEETSSTSFRVSRVALGPDNFIGNDVGCPVGGKTGANCLLGTKVMVPIDGEVREGVGLLGSPAFEIPRSVERDRRFDDRRSGEALRRGLAAKNRYNLQTIGVFLATRWSGVWLFALSYYAAVESYPVAAHLVSGLLFALSVVVGAIHLVLVMRVAEALSPVGPALCSIYDKAFWRYERLWKLQPIYYLHIFDGTPYKNLLWRLAGARIGRRVFDDGVHLSEPSLIQVGDEVVLGHRSKIQCHSQEDGTFKADRTVVGDGCTVGVGALVHYGVTMGDASLLAADSFLMKGEDVPPGARWGGNPAREMTHVRSTSHALA